MLEIFRKIMLFLSCFRKVIDERRMRRIDEKNDGQREQSIKPFNRISMKIFGI